MFKSSNIPDIACNLCGTVITERALKKVVSKTGIFFLVNADDGYWGITCPICDKVILKEETRESLDAIHDHFFKSKPLSPSKLRYNSYPYHLEYHKEPISYAGEYFKETKDKSQTIHESEIKSLVENDSVGLPDGYCTYFVDDPTIGPAIRIWWYMKEEIKDLVDYENNTGMKVFPRYIHRNNAIEQAMDFCWNYNLKEELIARLGFDYSYIAHDNKSRRADFSQVYNFLTFYFDSTKKNIGMLEKVVRKLADTLFSAKKGNAQKALNSYFENNNEVTNDSVLNSMEHFYNDFNAIQSNKAASSDIDETLLSKTQEYLLLDTAPSHEEILIEQDLNIQSDEDDLSDKVSLFEKQYPALKKIVGNNAAITKLKYKIAEISKFETDILVLGETGTGKELFCEAIHQASGREGPFIPLNCAGLSKELFESELFGHKKGAFTGADKDRTGAFLEASTGTLFMDELGEIPVELQAQLLRALDYREIRPVGTTAIKNFDTKVVFATNRNLEKGVEEGTFRNDLFYRIFNPCIVIPPLRERPEDIPLLIKHFIIFYNQKFNKHVTSISTDALDKFRGYSFPGNIRELKKIVETLVMTVSGSRITIDDLPMTMRSAAIPRYIHDSSLPQNTITDEDIEYWMKELNNNKTQVANKLGITYRTVLRHCKKLGI